MVIIDILFQFTSDMSTLGTYSDRPVRARFPIYTRACTSELIKCIKCPGRTNIATYVIYIYTYIYVYIIISCRSLPYSQRGWRGLFVRAQ